MVNILRSAYNGLTHYPDKLQNAIFHPLSEDNFKAANNAELFSPTWFSTRIKIGVKGAVLAFPVTIAFSAIATLWGSILAPVQVAHSIKMLEQLSNPSRRMMILIAFLRPIEEEIVCRAIIQPTLRGSCRKFLDANNPEDIEKKRDTQARIIAVALTAVLFGGLHQNLVQGIYAVFGGLYLGYLRERTDSTFTSTVAHITNNSLTTFVMPILFR